MHYCVFALISTMLTNIREGFWWSLLSMYLIDFSIDVDRHMWTCQGRAVGTNPSFSKIRADLLCDRARPYNQAGEKPAPEGRTANGSRSTSDKYQVLGRTP